ncbi:uncharacterized protein LOC107647270 [Arachis ipaensis]|nr:uncharacterized protein LOC107647270 [Arachis ipaensis]
MHYRKEREQQWWEQPPTMVKGSDRTNAVEDNTRRSNNSVRRDGDNRGGDNQGKSTMMCIYCEKPVRGGGINRFKYHLAEKGDVEKCKKVPPAVAHQFGQNIEEFMNKKRKTQENYAKSYEHVMRLKENLIEWKSLKHDSNNNNNNNNNNIQEQVNSVYYQPVIDAITNMGAGYKGPNFGRVRGYLLSKLVEDMKKIIEWYHEIWKQTGCTIMADGWTDRCRHTLINFLVYCPKGTIFLKSVDASHASKTTDLLFELFKDVVNFVGPENVVHIVTDNAANYVAAGRLLEAEFPKLY